MGEKITVGGSLMHSDGPKPDFGGWATKANLRCSDGRMIMPDAFKHQDQVRVPLVWAHGHDDPTNVLGHAILEARDEGIYAHGYFNETETGQHAKNLVEHEDISQLSIFANQLKEQAKNVIHGIIREVSLVMAGANPGALIDNITIQHADGMTELEDEAIIYTGLSLKHEDETKPDDGPTVQDVYDSMSDEQKNVTHFMVGQAVEAARVASEGEDDDDDNKQVTQSAMTDDKTGQQALNHEQEGTTRMTRNVFDQTQQAKDGPKAKHTLSHDDMKTVLGRAEELGSMRAAVEEYGVKHSIENIDILFPDAQLISQTPEFDQRRVEWVKAVWNGLRKSPFSRIKTMFADITHDEARAKGYIKGNFKKEEFFGLAKRITRPTTIYKKQKLDRDDILDITGFDVVAWMKAEMRLMLDEELSRVVLIGDGREIDDEDKIKDPAGANDGEGVRSILHDHDLYAATVNIPITGANADGMKIVDSILLQMGKYKGSGQPTLYTTLPMLTRLLLTRDGMNRRLYRTKADLAAELMVKDIVEVEVMETVEGLIGIIVNLQDYTVGADRGGEVTMFEDFDIDYNQHKYLIETRVSGALTKIRSALVLKAAEGDDVEVIALEPAFDETDGTLVVPTITGLTYRRADTNAVLTEGAPVTLTPGQSLKVVATANSGYYMPNNVDDEWTFERPAA